MAPPLESPAMYGPLISVLLMGMVPAWGAHGDLTALSHGISVAPPAASPQELATLDSRLTASGAIIVDLDSGQTLYDRNMRVSRPMASLTKLMTALIISENHELDEIVTVPAGVDDVAGTVAHLPEGQKFTVGDLLSASLIMSANDAAYTLAIFHSGTTEDFAKEMNARAKELGLKGTTYLNATGLDEATQQSSPRDLAWLAMFVMKNPELAERLSTRTTSIRSVSGMTIGVTHTHQLLRAEDSDVLAGKTGTTDAAGQCLMSIVEADGRKYIAILLHSRDRYADMRQILTTLTN
jgi:D-alanyl-D-alanine carboxypeptidase (penicillin-binding protein 5/6)